MEPGKIVRQGLVSTQNPQPETVAKTIYANGRIGFLDSLRKDDWLFYVDCDTWGIPENWTLFALNMKTGEKKAIAQSQNTGLIYAYAVDGNRVAVISISTLQRQELDRACFDSDYNWTGVALSGDMLFATRFHDTTRTFDLVRYDLKSGSGQPLDPALSATVSWVDGGSLAASSGWLAWTYNQNSGYLYHLPTGVSRQVPAPNDVSYLKSPQINGRWLSWRVNDQPVVYDIEQNTLRYLGKLGDNQRLREMVMYGSRAAWVVDLQADQGVSDSVIEWVELP